MSLIDRVAPRVIARYSRIRRTLARRDIFLWAAVILFANQIVGSLNGMPSASLQSLIIDLGAVGVFQYLAWYVVFYLLGSSDPSPAARLRDFLVTTALCLLIFLPTSRMIWIAASFIAIYLWFFNSGDLKLRAAGTVLGALSVQELWGHVLFNLVATPLVRAEAAAVGTILEVGRPGTVWHDNAIRGPDGYGIVIIGPCSSFHNLSLALLCWVAVSRWRNQDWRVSDFVIAAAIGIAMILFNMTRLCLMGWNVDLYHYWHDGAGAEIFAIGASLTVLLMSLIGVGLTRRWT